MAAAQVREKSRVPIEYLFTIFTFLTLSGGLGPLFYDFFGKKSEDYTEVNPIRLLVTIVLYFICGVLACMNWAKTKEILSKNLFIFILFLLPMITIVWSVDPATTFRRAFAHILTGALCVYVVGRMSPEELLRRLMLAFLIGGLFSFLYVAASPGMAIHHGGGLDGSWKGVYGHKNELGRVAAIAIITCLFVTSRTRMEEYLRLATMGVFLVLLILSQSRTNWFIVAAMAGVIPLTRFLRNGRVSRGIRITCFLIAVTAMALTVTVGADALLAAVGRDATFSGRATLWRGVNNIIAAKYPYLGAGYGAFFTEKGAIYDLAPYLSYWSGIPNHAHSGYLNTRANMGIPGLVALTLFILIAGNRLLNRIMSETNRKVWAGFCALFFLFLVNNFSESVAFKHSDIAWVIILIIYVYAEPAFGRVRIRVRTSRPQPATSLAYTRPAE